MLKILTIVLQRNFGGKNVASQFHLLAMLPETGSPVPEDKDDKTEHLTQGKVLLLLEEQIKKRSTRPMF